jgi:hypothetical protein
MLVLGGIFFLMAAVISTIVEVPKMMKEIKKLNAPPPIVRSAV